MGNRYHHGDLAGALLAAGRSALARASSPADLSIRALAREVGVSPQAPYRHFDDRDALLRAIAAAGYRDLTRRLAGRAGASSVGEVWERLVREEPALATLMVTTRPEAELADAVREWLAAVAGVVESAGVTDPVAVLERAVGVWAAVHGLTVLREGGYLGGFDPWMLPDAGTLAGRIAGG